MEKLSLTLLACGLAVVMAGAASADDAASAGDAAWVESLRTSADALHWSDELIRHEWRMQRRPGTDECRLLDPEDRVVRTGSRDECATAWKALESSGSIPPPARGVTVIVLHGLGEGRRSMRPLVTHLRERLDATVVSFGYASTKAAIADHGKSLAAVVAALPAADRVSFVGHSLGNLVVRSWMAQARGHELDRVERMVMLGPPNQGSDLAKMASKIWLVAALSEGAARDLVVDWHKVGPTLPAPTCPFGIVAGGKGDGTGYSLLLEGDDDAVVRVDETRLDGVDDFLLLPVHHAAMMKDPTVQEAVASFLSTGRFPVAARQAAP